MISVLGGVLIDDIREASTATHLIAGEKGSTLLRTPKLMIGLCVTSNVVSIDWLLQSAMKNTVLPAQDYLLLRDRKAEKRYNFSMRKTLQRGDLLRKRGATLLEGRSVYVCKGVAGKKAPPTEELKLIVEAAGGIWLSGPSKLRGLQGNDALIITSDPVDKRQLTPRDVAKAIKEGVRHFTTSWFFQCIVTQEVSGI